MLNLEGTVKNVFEAPSGKDKEGKAYGGGFKVQIEGLNILKNGEKRIDLMTMACKDPVVYKDAMGKVIRVPVGVFASGKGVQFYITSDAIDVL